MYSIMKQGSSITPYVVEFTVSTREDVETLPKAPQCAFGSDAICTEDSSVWMLNTENEWVEI